MRTTMRLISTLAFSLALVLAPALSTNAAVFNHAARVMNASYSSTAAINSDEIATDWTSLRVTFVIVSSQAGTVRIQYQGRSGEWVFLTAALTVPATTTSATRVTIDDVLPRTRAVFTPDAATAGTVWIDAFAHGTR